MSTSKINIVVRLQHWMDSVPGQTFLNYAYSWGAAIVILGTLFKLTHLSGANLMLFIGMGTEVVVFFLSAFDRPFDKKEQGKELPEDYETDEEIAARLGLNEDEDTDDEESNEVERAESTPAPTLTGVQGGGTLFIGGLTGNAVAASTGNTEATPASAPIAVSTVASNGFLVQQAQATVNPELEEASQAYVEKLKSLTETLARVEAQSARLTTDSEEMVNLNRTLTGINTVYEVQLKSISAQVGTIDQINEQTRRMAQQIEELNGVYSRMIKALTVNMKNAAGAAGVE